MSDRITDDKGVERLLEGAHHKPARLAPETSLLGGRFVIRRFLDSGSMGLVYEAFDTERDAYVALKTLSSVDASGIYRLKQEFRALADVVHPNLVGLHELFSDKDLWFFTMDLVSGDTLLNQLGKAPDEGKVRQVFSQLATGIQAIHDASKLHRDLKPSNVLLTPEGQVVILDFGLAVDQEVGEVGQTISEDSISGTPTYMSPEQAASKPASPASDWYAFGVMLFEAITGRPPFEGTSHTVLTRKQREDAPKPSSIRRDVPEDLEKLCIQLLQRDPETRPSWQQVMQVLGPMDDQLDSLIPQDEVPFVGRAEELEALQKAFEATDEGLPVVVFVHGVSGVGKTTLVEQYLRELKHRGKAVVLTGRCYERESVPFKACDSLIDALSRYLRQLHSEQAAVLLPRQIHAIAQLFPALQRLDLVRNLKQRHPLPPDPNEFRRVAFSAFKELLTNIAAQEPLVLYIDDLQWSDIDGAKLLSSTLFRPEPPSMLLIGAYRSEEVDTSPGLTTLRKRINELDGVKVNEIVLHELNQQESQKLAKDLLPNKIKNSAARIAKEAQGSPFFITELARYAATGQVRAEQFGLKDAIKGRLSSLSEVEREVLEAVCVSARPMEQSFLRAVINKGDVAMALRKLQVDRLVRRIASGTSSKIRSYHDRIRESVVAAMDAGYFKQWHGKLAQALETSDSPDFIALTEHLLGAGELLKAGTYAVTAADQAAETLAFESAARLYQIALELNPGDRENQRKLQTKLGTALANAGRGAQAAQTYMQAADGAQPKDAQELSQLAAQQWILTGHLDEGTRELSNVLKTVGLKLHSRPSASIISLLAYRARIKLHGLEFKKRTVKDVTKKELLKLSACWTVIQGLYLADTLQATAFSPRFLWLAFQSGIVEEVVKGFACEAMYRAVEGVRVRSIVDEYLNRAQRLSRRVEDPEVLGTVQYALGVTGYLLGEFSRAKEYLTRAEKIFIENCTGVIYFLDATKNFLGSCHCFLGSWRELQQQWDAWIKDGQEREDLNLLSAQHTWAMGTYRWLAADQVDEARNQLSQGLAEWKWHSFDVQKWYAALSKSYIELYANNYKEAFDITKALTKRLSKTTLQRIQQLRVLNNYSLAHAALGFASISQDRRHPLRVARKQANKLARERSPMAELFVRQINACLAYLEGDEQTAVKLLRKAAKSFEEAQYKLFATSTNRQLGRLLGGDEGRALIVKADTAMKEEAIVNPERVAAMLAPGFPD